MLRKLILVPLVVLAAVTQHGRAQHLPAGTSDARDSAHADPGSARRREAEAALEKGDYPAAVALLKPLAAERPSDARLQYDLGFALDHAETPESERAAGEAYAAALSADPKMSEAAVALGLLDARAGRADKARAELLAVTLQESVAPELRATAFRALARLDQQTDPQRAGDELLAAIKLTGEKPEDAALTAVLAARTGDVAGSEAAFRRTLTAAPADPEAAAGLAQLLLRGSRPAEALEVLSPAVAAHPADPRVLSVQAAVLASVGNLSDAIADLEQVRSQPAFRDDLATARQLARMYAMDKRDAEAEKLFQLALAGTPHDPALMDDLATVLVHEQRFPEAEALLVRAVGLRAQFASAEAFGDAAGHLAFAASRAGHPDVCLRALALRATVLPNSAPSLFLQATAHDALHQYKEARQAYRAFLVSSQGKFPDQEFQARHRLVALDHMK